MLQFDLKLEILLELLQEHAVLLQGKQLTRKPAIHLTKATLGHKNS